MTKALIKLIDVKTIITLITTCVFAYLAIMSKIEANQFLTIFTMIISFYFGYKNGKTESLGDKQ